MYDTFSHQTQWQEGRLLPLQGGSLRGRGGGAQERHVRIS